MHRPPRVRVGRLGPMKCLPLFRGHVMTNALFFHSIDDCEIAHRRPYDFIRHGPANLIGQREACLANDAPVIWV